MTLADSLLTGINNSLHDARDRKGGQFHRIPVYLVSSLLVVLFVSVYQLLRLYSHHVPSNAPPVVKGDTPLSGAWGFWGARSNWCKKVRDLSRSGNYSFHVGRYHVIGLSGDEGRQVFFESKELGLVEG
jgi:hypothetical protein